MGKLLDAIIAKLQELDQRKQEPAPDYVFHIILWRKCCFISIGRWETA